MAPTRGSSFAGAASGFFNINQTGSCRRSEMAMPKESYMIPTAVPQRASSSATVPLNQPITVGNMPSPAQSQAATPIVSVPDSRRERPSTVSNPSGATSAYPAGTNLPAALPGGQPRRGQ
jgi:hypothetical protein